MAISAYFTTTPKIMLMVFFCLMPGVFAQYYFYGPFVFGKLIFAIKAALICEAICLIISRQPLKILMDGSALVTATLITICLPPSVSYGVLLIAIIAGIALGKHAYGGLGQNVFNPAMVGYLVVLISFPVTTTMWPPISYAPQIIDSLTTATPFDSYNNALRLDLNDSYNFTSYNILSLNNPWLIISGAFLMGGLILLCCNLIQWRISMAMLIGVVIGATIWPVAQPSISFSITWHLIHGATFIGAFFIATDPVTAPTGKLAQWLYGLIIGIITVLLRIYSSYPEGLAFAILLANATTPLWDRCCAQQNLWPDLFKFIKK